jgi:hypothetical protein
MLCVRAVGIEHTMPTDIYYSCGLYPKWVLKLRSCRRDWTLWLLLDHTKMRKDAVWLAVNRALDRTAFTAAVCWCTAAPGGQRPRASERQRLLLRLGETRFLR